MATEEPGGAGGDDEAGSRGREAGAVGGAHEHEHEHGLPPKKKRRTGPVPATLRRAGKKTGVGIEAGGQQERMLVRLLANTKEAWETPREGHSTRLSVAQWLPHLGLAEVTLQKGKVWKYTGFIWQGKLYCYPEEAAYLVDRCDLLLVHAGRALSLQECYSLLHGAGIAWETYYVYTFLKRLGYIVRRHGVSWRIPKDASFHVPGSAAAAAAAGPAAPGGSGLGSADTPYFFKEHLGEVGAAGADRLPETGEGGALPQQQRAPQKTAADGPGGEPAAAGGHRAWFASVYGDDHPWMPRQEVPELEPVTVFEETNREALGLIPFRSSAMEEFTSSGGPSAITFDGYYSGRSSNFAKSRPPQVDFHVCVSRTPLTLAQIREIQVESGGIPVKVAAVDNAEVMFYGMASPNVVPYL